MNFLHTYRVFNRNVSRQQNLRVTRRMDNRQGSLVLLECISCILEHELGYYNTTLISINFGAFFLTQREYMNAIIFLKNSVNSEIYMLRNSVTAPLRLLSIPYSCVQCISFVVTENVLVNKSGSLHQVLGCWTAASKTCVLGA